MGLKKESIWLTRQKSIFNYIKLYIYIESTKKVSKNLTPKVDISGNNFSPSSLGSYWLVFEKNNQGDAKTSSSHNSQRKQQRRNEGL